MDRKVIHYMTNPVPGICGYPECGIDIYARGWCKSHYNQVLSGQEMRPRGRRKPLQCEFPECHRPSRLKGYCTGHGQQNAAGRQLKPLRQDVADANPGICEFPLCGRKTVSSLRALCDRHHRMKRNGEELKPLRKPKTYKLQPIPDANGYLSIYVPRKNGRGKQIQHHRYVMEQHLGRELLRHENVHHINGVRDDNRLENLELWSKSQPSGQRVVDKLDWARQIISTYEKSAQEGLL